MNDPEFDRLLAEAVAAPFSGWDFSWIEGRRVEEEDTVTTWDYEERARKLVQAADSLLDLGTGGGERLSRLGPFPPLAVATEAYGPNVPIATRLLQPLGVQVVRTHPAVHDSRGPQPDGRFAERRPTRQALQRSRSSTPSQRRPTWTSGRSCTCCFPVPDRPQS